MTAAIENIAEAGICASTERVRPHRQRRRNRLRLMSVAMPEASIDQAITRGLLKPEDRSRPWSVIQASIVAKGHKELARNLTNIA